MTEPDDIERRLRRTFRAIAELPVESHALGPRASMRLLTIGAVVAIGGAVFGLALAYGPRNAATGIQAGNQASTTVGPPSSTAPSTSNPPPSTTEPSTTTTLPSSVLPTAPNCDLQLGGSGFEPTDIFIGCATSADNLGSIHWSSWTPTNATGTAMHNINNCQPDCAGGTFASFPVEVTLSDPTILNGVSSFATIVMTPTTSAGSEGIGHGFELYMHAVGCRLGIRSQ